MSKLHTKRMILVLIMIMSVSLAAALILYALKQNINFFYTPSEIAQESVPQNSTIRVGGMVKKDSIIRGEGLHIQFVVTDFHKEITVFYNGIVPDLFKEGQGVVILGSVQKKGVFEAHEILAKHDENYMPSEAKVAIERGAKLL